LDETVGLDHPAEFDRRVETRAFITSSRPLRLQSPIVFSSRAFAPLATPRAVRASSLGFAHSSRASRTRLEISPMASPRAVPAKTLGARAMDVAFKAFTGTLFAATVVTGGWFAATSASAVGHYDRLAKEAAKRREEEAREAAKRREEEERRKKSAWRLFG